MVGGLCAACGSGNAFGNECVYDDAAGIPHGNRHAVAHVHCNADVSVNYHRCAAHSDATRDVHRNA